MPSKKDIEKVEKFIKDAAQNPAKVERAVQRYEELRSRRGPELEMWHHWNNNGRQSEHLEPLLKSLDPLIAKETKRQLKGLGGSISSVALKNQLRNHTVRALELYDPSKSALTTHVVNNFKRVSDFVASNRNARYMPKELVGKYQELQNAKNEFIEETGREPTLHEIHAKLPTWQPKHIARMMKGFGREAYTDMGTDLEHDVQNETQIERIRDAVSLMRTTLNEQQQRFAELHYPQAGTKQKSVEQIAKILGVPEHKAYRIKRTIENKLSPIIKGQ